MSMRIARSRMFIIPIIPLYLLSCKAQEQDFMPQSASDTLRKKSGTVAASLPLPPDSASPSIENDAMPVARIDTVIVGDLDGDRIPDTAWIDVPASNQEVWEMTRIRFSADLPFLIDSQSIGGALATLPDLDENGTPELVFLPDWATSCWAGLRVYGLREGAWKMFAAGSYYRCNDDAYHPDSLRARVLKIGKGTFDLLEDQWTEEGDEMVRLPQRFTVK